MSESVLPFEIQVLFFDVDAGRKHLMGDVHSLLGHAKRRKDAGDLLGAQVLARLALTYFHTVHPPNRSSGPQ